MSSLVGTCHWGKIERIIDPSNFEGFKDYLKYNAEYLGRTKPIRLTWEEDCERIISRFIIAQGDSPKEKRESIKQDFIKEILPLQKGIENLITSTEITEKELKTTDQSLHTEAYTLSIDYPKLLQEISDTKLSSDQELVIDTSQTDQKYRLYMVVSSSLGACHPCSLLVSTYPFEQIQQGGCKIPVTTFYIQPRSVIRKKFPHETPARKGSKIEL